MLRRLLTDRLRSYSSAAREIASVAHSTAWYRRLSRANVTWTCRGVLLGISADDRMTARNRLSSGTREILVKSTTSDGGEGGIRSRRTRPHQQLRPVFNRSNREKRSKPQYQGQNRYSRLCGRTPRRRRRWTIEHARRSLYSGSLNRSWREAPSLRLKLEIAHSHILRPVGDHDPNPRSLSLIDFRRG